MTSFAGPRRLGKLLLAAAVSCGLVAVWLGRAAPPAAQGLLEPALELHQVVADPERFEGRRVRARGVYDLERTVLVTEARRDRVRGARVWTPLHLAHGEGRLVVWIERGWIPEDEIDHFAERDEADTARVIYGRVRPLEFGPVPTEAGALPTRVEALRPPELQAGFAVPLLPLAVVREAGSGIELPLAPAAPAPVGAPPSAAASHTAPFWGASALLVGTWLALRVRTARAARRAARRPRSRVGRGRR